ncbi:myelin protein P0, partial [Loxodonta africana]|uniref:myelin protein P0 n=1 Tax=Loxodonta africana TaxID=9785 RepID=UPI0030CF3CAC
PLTCHSALDFLLLSLPLYPWSGPIRGVSDSCSVLAVLSPAQAIVVYTDKEVHGEVGSRVTLHCSFWSSEWVSDDISFTWRYQPEGGRDAISIFHYAKGQPYIDEVGTFKERIQWVGDPQWKDGSIVIHNLDYSDNGTFTCDVKNPPDIVGKTSQVTLYVFEKGVRENGRRESGRQYQAAQGLERTESKGWGKRQRAGPCALQTLGGWAESSHGPKFSTSGNRCGGWELKMQALFIPSLLSPPLPVPTRYGVVLGAVIGGVLGVVLLLLLLFYVVRYCWQRRQAALQRRLSAMEKGKVHKPGKDTKRGRQVSWTWGPDQPGRALAAVRGGIGLVKAPWPVTDVCTPPPQTPVLYAMLDHTRSTKAVSEKKPKGLGESRKDKK